MQEKMLEFEKLTCLIPLLLLSVFFYWIIPVSFPSAYPVIWVIFVTEQLCQRYEVRIWWKAPHHLCLVSKERENVYSDVANSVTKYLEFNRIGKRFLKCSSTSLMPETRATHRSTKNTLLYIQARFPLRSRDYRCPRYGSPGCLQNTSIPKREKRAVTTRKVTTYLHGVYAHV